MTVVLVVAVDCGGRNNAERVARTPTTAAAPTAATTTRTESNEGAGSGFVAFGDFGGGPRQKAVADAMSQWAAGHRVDALVTAGDNVYDRGEPEHFEAQLDEPYRDLRATRPLWVTLGNHDAVGGYGSQQLSYLGLPALPYAKELPGVQLLFLDGNRVDAAQAGWLRARLAEPGPAFRVVVFHPAAYTCGRYDPDPRVQARWVPILEEAAVDLVLTAHDHNYQRFRSSGGVTYIVTGGGGRNLYPVDPSCTLSAPRLAAAARNHFVAVEIENNRMRLTAVAETGETIDTTEIPAAHATSAGN